MSLWAGAGAIARGRGPQGPRGLKSREGQDAQQHSNRRGPQGPRGLKSRFYGRSGSRLASRSARTARIEMHPATYFGLLTHVAVRKDRED